MPMMTTASVTPALQATQLAAYVSPPRTGSPAGSRHISWHWARPRLLQGTRAYSAANRIATAATQSPVGGMTRLMTRYEAAPIAAHTAS